MSNLFKILLTLILITTSVTAIQDTNLTINTYGLEICISADNITNQICNNSEVLTIDGTQDHNIYFTQKIELENNATLLQQFEYGVFTPFQLILGSSAILISVVIGLAMIYIIYNALKGN